MLSLLILFGCLIFSYFLFLFLAYFYFYVCRCISVSVSFFFLFFFFIFLPGGQFPHVSNGKRVVFETQKAGIESNCQERFSLSFCRCLLIPTHAV